MNFDVPIIINEPAGYPRIGEPVSAGVPMPQGELSGTTHLSLRDDGVSIPLQTKTLARWPDGSVKWLLLDFSAHVPAHECKSLSLLTRSEEETVFSDSISISENHDTLVVDTSSAQFYIPTDRFMPFSQVIAGGCNILSSEGTSTLLTDEEGNIREPVITSWQWETRGPLRSTLKISGKYQHGEKPSPLFIARLSFFYGKTVCKIDFTLWNPSAARHPGGLWDLGDPGSYLFQDLSFHLHPESSAQGETYWTDDIHRPMQKNNSDNFLIYQDSSGGVNWNSRNHVNRHNEVKVSFRGYRISVDNHILKEGQRAQPCCIVGNEQQGVGIALRSFWQNFPKALEVKKGCLSISLFPDHFNDLFELQGGERKTHTFFVDFSVQTPPDTTLTTWVHSPVDVKSSPEWYAKTQAIQYLSPGYQDGEQQLYDLVLPAIEGSNTFNDRREVVDEYGWRNFGDWYADHEAVGHGGDSPLISHYNNQYDCLYGTLCQYFKSGDTRWFHLADELCHHVRDIDIYHTSEDKPEYNNGLFWHTEHYLDVQTATHRCFSKRHAEFRDLNSYGGGTANSHNYTWGLLSHYYVTGEEDSRLAVLQLAEFIRNGIASETTLASFLIDSARRLKVAVKAAIKGQEMVELFKVYGLCGPGREAGNAVSTLLAAYELSEDKEYLLLAEKVIKMCVHPHDDIEKMDLADIENRWMYTVFLQALGKYLDTVSNTPDTTMWNYVRDSLLHYSRWMVAHEYFYLDVPHKLEYPNETWAAQEIRKSNVLFYAAKYCDDEQERKVFFDKAVYFYTKCCEELITRDTRFLTRPISILMQNCLLPTYCIRGEGFNDFTGGNDKSNFKYGNPLMRERLARTFVSVACGFSLRREIDFISSRLKRII